jgi:hypothetical protein
MLAAETRRARPLSLGSVCGRIGQPEKSVQEHGLKAIVEPNLGGMP